MISSFHLFGQEIHIYGLAWFLGIFLSAIIAILICKRRTIERYDIVYSAIYAVIAGAIGAKLLFIAVTIEPILGSGLPFSAVLKGGFVFYGGLIGGALGLFIYTKQFRLKFLPFADIYAVVLPLGHAIGRMGCLFAGCCYGMPYNGPLAITYYDTAGNVPFGVPLFPIQALEAFLLLLLFALNLLIYLRGKKSGTTSAVYLICYSILRFVLEIFRGDGIRGISAGLSTSQWISIILFCFGTVAVIYTKIKKSVCIEE